MLFYVWGSRNADYGDTGRSICNRVGNLQNGEDRFSAIIRKGRPGGYIQPVF